MSRSDDAARDERRRELVARAFGPGGTPGDLRALAEHDRQPVHEPVVVEARAVGDEVIVDQVVVAEIASAERPPRPRHRILPFAIAAAALVVVAGGAFALGSAARGPDPAPTVGSAAARLESVERTLPAFVPPDFTGAGVPKEIPLKLIPSNLDPTTFDQAGFETDTLPPGTHIYIAKDTTNNDCLVVVNQGVLSSVCTSPRYFPASGLTLTWTNTGAGYTITWQLDGSMTLAFG
jgi:hypothetical protein